MEGNSRVRAQWEILEVEQENGHQGEGSKPSSSWTPAPKNEDTAEFSEVPLGMQMSELSHSWPRPTAFWRRRGGAQTDRNWAGPRG